MSRITGSGVPAAHGSDRRLRRSGSSRVGSPAPAIRWPMDRIAGSGDPAVHVPDRWLRRSGDPRAGPPVPAIRLLTCQIAASGSLSLSLFFNIYLSLSLSLSLYIYIYNLTSPHPTSCPLAEHFPSMGFLTSSCRAFPLQWGFSRPLAEH